MADRPNPERTRPEERGVTRETIALLLSVLFAIGGGMLLVTLLFPGDPQRETGAIAVIGASALASAAILMWAHDRIPLLALKLAPAYGTALIALVLYFAGPTASASYSVFVIWVVLGAALFFEVRMVLLHGFIAVTVMVIMFEVREPQGVRPGLEIALTAATVIAAALVTGGLASQLRAVVARLEAAARTDPLTGLLNRRAVAEELERELSRAARSEQAVGIVVLDLDDFKLYNDSHGHPAGDVVLRRLAKTLRRATRAIDHVARLGGEEFAVLAPESDLAGSLAMAERLRRAIEIEFSGDGLTASFGVSSFPANGRPAQDLLGAADQALYEAKAQGRNRAVASRVGRAPAGKRTTDA